MGRKRIKGEGILWDEPKKRVSIVLTPTAIEGLDKMADSLNISRSELIEMVGRGDLRQEEISDSEKKLKRLWILLNGGIVEFQSVLRRVSRVG
jgi:tartrate dehydratase beta subunit/fumarate hydratase class I family protein